MNIGIIPFSAPVSLNSIIFFWFRYLYIFSLYHELLKTSFEKTVDDVLDQLADHIEQQLDVDAILACAR